MACLDCGFHNPPGFKFCGSCGAGLEDPATVVADHAPDLSATGAVGGGDTSQTQNDAAAGNTTVADSVNLILIRGESDAGISYPLEQGTHVAGRTQGDICFPDDPFLSPKHATFFFQNGSLFVTDEDSDNGIHIRIRAEVQVRGGTSFLAGEQFFMIHQVDTDMTGPQKASDDTYYYGTPRRMGTVAISQRLIGGQTAMRFVARKPVVSIGREESDINFPDDIFLSKRHAEIRVENQKIFLRDIGSHNGTYVKIRGTQPLKHDDFIFLGQQLFRIQYVR